MEKKCTFIFDVTIALLILNNYWVCTADNGVSLSTDQHALEAIRAQITDDDSGILSKNWTANTSICTWTGVSCGFRFQTQRVVALDLSHMGLVGRISPHIGNLSFLTFLNITNNSFHGSIPPEIMQLRHLEEVYMGQNNLTGNLPLSYFYNLPKLEKLFLDNNNLIGTLSPFFLDNMTSLKTLFLSHNSLHGNIPEDIGNGSSLQDLNLNHNQLTGSVPQTLFNHSSLRRIGLSFNILSGSLPENMCDQLDNLILFTISGNKFTGPIPSSIYKCQQLQYLSMSINKFNDSIPREIGNLTLLKELYLGLNDLQGSIPMEIGNLKRLEILSIPNGNLVGHVPHVIFNMSSLRVVAFSNNSLSGVLFTTIYINLPNLEELWLDHNQFTGQVPPNFWRLKGIRKLMLLNNCFTGSVPPEVGNLTWLTHLSLNDNKFTVEWPRSIARLTPLEGQAVAALLSLPGSVRAERCEISERRLALYRLCSLSSDRFDPALSELQDPTPEDYQMASVTPTPEETDLSDELLESLTFAPRAASSGRNKRKKAAAADPSQPSVSPEVVARQRRRPRAQVVPSDEAGQAPPVVERVPPSGQDGEKGIEASPLRSHPPAGSSLADVRGGSNLGALLARTLITDLSTTPPQHLSKESAAHLAKAKGPVLNCVLGEYTKVAAALCHRQNQEFVKLRERLDWREASLVEAGQVLANSRTLHAAELVQLKADLEAKAAEALRVANEAWAA